MMLMSTTPRQLKTAFNSTQEFLSIVTLSHLLFIQANSLQALLLNRYVLKFKITADLTD